MAYIQEHDELLLAWKQPRTRQRFLIGYLRRNVSGFRFWYEQQTPFSVREALDEGFSLLSPFPEIDTQYGSNVLFPIFRRRAQPALRNTEISERINLPDKKSDQAAFEALRLTGGRLPTDTLEFLEAGRHHQGVYRVQFPIAGWRHYDGESVVQEFIEGTKVTLQPEPDNDWDPSAIRIHSPSGAHVGYVPAVYSWYLESAVSNSAYTAEVCDIESSGDPQRRIRLLVTVTVGNSPDQPFRLIPAGIDDYARALLD
jgi:hypothetical protein